MSNNQKPPKLRLVPPEIDSDPDRRQHPHQATGQRRGGDRRQNIAGRGQFNQYFNLYHLVYNSDRTTDEISAVFAQIMPDEAWQVRFIQEVTLDRMFQKRKSKDELREFFLKCGVVEVHEDGEMMLPISS